METKAGPRDEPSRPRSLLQGTLVQIIYLSLVTSIFLLLPPLVSFITPFSFPFRNALLIYGISVIVIILVVFIDVGRTAVGLN